MYRTDIAVFKKTDTDEKCVSFLCNGKFHAKNGNAEKA
jgi:hypothetical protein